VPAKTPVRIGSIVAVTFLDHVEDGDEPIEFVVYGELLQASRSRLHIGGWVYANPKEREYDTGNMKTWSIVRAAITQIKVLKK